MIKKKAVNYNYEDYGGRWEQEYDVVFPAQFRHYDEETGDWYYMGGPTQALANHDGHPFGVWVWEWETQTAQFSRHEAVDVIIQSQKLSAEVKAWTFGPNGVYYDLDVGVTQLAQSEIEDLSTDRDKKVFENFLDRLRAKRSGYQVSCSPVWQETRSDGVMRGIRARPLNVPEKLLCKVNRGHEMREEQPYMDASQFDLSASNRATPDLPIPRP